VVNVTDPYGRILGFLDREWESMASLNVLPVTPEGNRERGRAVKSWRIGWKKCLYESQQTG
jgi:hypothetical protein